MTTDQSMLSKHPVFKITAALSFLLILPHIYCIPFHTVTNTLKIYKSTQQIISNYIVQKTEGDCEVSLRSSSQQSLTMSNAIGFSRESYLFVYLFSCILFILLSLESDQCTIQAARLGVASHLSTTPRWGNPAKCLSQRHK